MKKVAILYSEYTPTIDAIKYALQDTEIACFCDADKITENYDLIVTVNYKGNCQNKALVCHHSLLPAFNCDEPIKEALLSGVKVTGITIYITPSKKILFQYPVLISDDTNYTELESELNFLEQSIYPIVIKQFLNNPYFIFDFS